MAEANPQFSAGEIRRALQEKFTDIIDVLDANQLSSVLFFKLLITREDFQNLKWVNHRAGSMAQVDIIFFRSRPNSSVWFIIIGHFYSGQRKYLVQLPFQEAYLIYFNT